MAEQGPVQSNAPNPILEWSYYIDDAAEVQDLSELEGHQFKQALEYLQRTLGKDFLERTAGAPHGAPHPLLDMLLNRVAWTRRELTRFADDLRTLDGSEHFREVQVRLAKADTFQHDRLMVKAAAKLSGDGFRACFEPTLPVRDNQRQPDVRLGNSETGETLFLEVAVQTMARRDREAHQASWDIVHSLMGITFDLRWAGRLHKTPSAPHMQDILERIKVATARAINERTLIVVQEEDTIEMAFCHNEKAGLLHDWCKERSIREGGFAGPPVNTDHIERLRQKIRKEQEQLPPDHANALLIQDTDIFFLIGDPKLVISQVEEEVYKYPHVPIVIVHGVHLAGSGVPAILQKGEHRYTRRDLDGMMTEDNFLLLNRYSSAKLSANALAKFYRAF